jgi:hypothetical protein
VSARHEREEQIAAVGSASRRATHTLTGSGLYNQRAHCAVRMGPRRVFAPAAGPPHCSSPAAPERQPNGYASRAYRGAARAPAALDVCCEPPPTTTFSASSQVVVGATLQHGLVVTGLVVLEPHARVFEALPSSCANHTTPAHTRHAETQKTSVGIDGTRAWSRAVRGGVQDGSDGHPTIGFQRAGAAAVGAGVSLRRCLYGGRWKTATRSAAAALRRCV